MVVVNGVNGKRSRHAGTRSGGGKTITAGCGALCVVVDREKRERGGDGGVDDTRTEHNQRMRSDLRSVIFYNPVKMSEYDQLNSTASRVLYDISIVSFISRAAKEWLERGDHATCVEMTKSQK